MQVSDIESIRSNVTEAIRLFLEAINAGEPLAAYGDMPAQTQGRVFVATDRALCVFEAGELSQGGRTLPTTTCRAVAWSDVRGFQYRVVYAADFGSASPVLAHHELAIAEPELPQVIGSDRYLRDFAAVCQQRLIGIGSPNHDSR